MKTSSIPSIKILPALVGYCFAISLASIIGRSIFQYLDTTLIGKGRQIFSSWTKGSKSSWFEDSNKQNGF